MLKILTSIAAAGLLVAFTAGTPAQAAPKSEAGISEAQQSTDFSSQRRARRYHHRQVRRYHRGPRVYRRHARYPYYHRPYYRSYYSHPGMYAGFGPFGFGFGPGWRW